VATPALRPVQPIQQRHLWEQIADDLREAIHSGELTAGSRLVTAELAERWGVSRGPVREALMALENEGIVVSTRRQGTIVGTPSTLDLREIYDVREVVETAVAGRLCQQPDLITQTDLRELADLLEQISRHWKRNEPLPARKLDFTFHQRIVDLGGNSRFSAIYRQMLSQTMHHLKGVVVTDYPRVGWATMKEAHEQILSALVSADPAAISAAITSHYAGAKRVYAVPDPTD